MLTSGARRRGGQQLSHLTDCFLISDYTKSAPLAYRVSRSECNRRSFLCHLLKGSRTTGSLAAAIRCFQNGAALRLEEEAMKTVIRAESMGTQRLGL